MNQFTTITAQIDRIFTHVSENAEGVAIENVGLEVHHGVTSDVIFTPIAMFERRFGFRMSPIAKQALVGGMVIYDRSVIREGEEFVYFKGAEEVHQAENDLTINNIKSVVINPMFASVLGMLEPASTESVTRNTVKTNEPKNSFNPADYEKFNDEPTDESTAKAGATKQPKAAKVEPVTQPA